MKSRVTASLFAVGFIAMLGQVVLLRELAVASFGVELIYLLGLGLWLAAGAAGAAAGRTGAPPAGGEGAATAFLCLAALLPLEIAFLRAARLILGGVPGAYLPLGRQVATAALGMAPAGAVLGLLFRSSARRLIAEGGSLAAAYAWESAGGALGSAVATLALHWGVSNMALGAAAGVASAVAAALPGRRGWLPAAALLLMLLASSRPLDRWMTGWSHPGLAATADTPFGRVVATRAGEQVVVFENDALVFESEGTEAEEFVHVAALHAPSVSRVLALGGGVSGVVGEIRKHGPARVDCVESDRRMYEAVLPLLSPAARGAVQSAPVRVVFADPRRYLSGAFPAYDLILVAAPEPASGQSNRFYTGEFFRQCASRLAPAGVLAFRLPSSENFWTPALARRNGSVYAALRRAFADVRVLPGGTDTYLASAATLPRDPETLAGRLRERGVASRLVTAEYLRYLLTNDRTEAVDRRLREVAAPPNSDGKPICYQQTALLWLGRFIPSAGASGAPGGRVWPGLLAAAAALLLLLARFRLSARRAMLAAVAGFGGMTAEGAVLLRYQAEAGSLYRDIGILLTSFMAGLAAGAFLFDRAASRRAASGRGAGAALLGGFALLNLWIAGSPPAGGALFGLASSALALALAGLLVAGIFGYSSAFRVDDPGKTVAPLYAADLLGGCVGSVLAGILLIPLFGVGATSAATAVLAVAALVLL